MNWNLFRDLNKLFQILEKNCNKAMVLSTQSKLEMQTLEMYYL